MIGRLLAKLPFGLLSAIGAALGWLLWALRIRRGVVMENLRLAFPEKSEAERRDIARRTFLNLGRMAPDFLRVPHLSKEALERIFVYDRFEIFEDAIAKGNGVIACTAHFGNFEVLAAAHTLRGYPVTMISRVMGKSGANDLWRGARQQAGVEDLVVKKGDTLRAAVRSLKAGRHLGYVIDQNQAKRHAIFPTFFGVPAATAATPAILARRTGATVIFVVSFPLGDGRHQVSFEGPIELPDTGDRERDALLFMQDLNDRLERQVRLHPEQWYWLHRRWKTRPDAAPGEASAAPARGGASAGASGH